MKNLQRLLLLLGLILVLVGFSLTATRLQQSFPGFNPLPAVFFCVAACMGGRWLWLPTVAWLVSYALINTLFGYAWSWQILIVVAGFGAATGAGLLLRGRGGMALLGGSVGAAVLFYVVTNSGSWLLSPQYSKTWAGFLQAQTVGLPGPFPPAWAFLRGSVTAGLLFAGVFLLGQRQWSRHHSPAGELVPVRVRR